MPLSTQHIQAAELLHLIMFFLSRPLALFKHLRPAGLISLRVCVRIQPKLTHLLNGLELGVAAKHNIGTTPGHISCHSHRALTARLCHDMRLALIIFRVQHLMTHAFFRQLA